jgi:hypothetical protein
MQCKCKDQEVLVGQQAYHYSKQEYIREVGRAKGGWRYLLKCEICGSYWEITWEGGGGFDDGVMTLRRLSKADMLARWPNIEKQEGKFS